MADSGALRARRLRAHRRGDHVLCDSERCNEATPASGSAPSVVTESVTAITAPVALSVVSDPSVPAPRAADGDQGDDELAMGGLETMARAFVDALPYERSDPRFIIGEIAILLAKRVDEDGAVPAAVRELRTLLMQLAESPNGPAGAVDEGRLKRAQRRLDGILAQVR